MYDQNFDKVNSNLWNAESYRLMWNRLAISPTETDIVIPAIQGIHMQRDKLEAAGGTHQQDRMIRDKRRTLDRAVLYSYQAAFIKKYIPDYLQEQLTEDEKPRKVRGLINPNKLKQEYDEKILSVGYENNFQPGDVFEWCNTGTYWLIYLQNLDELAYFRGDIRKCQYQITWLDDGTKKSTYVSVRGPVETKINWEKEHSTIIDTPNWSLDILMPKNEDTMKQFHRYSKFFLQGGAEPDSKICYQVQVVDSISIPGVMEVIAVEYYANKDEDDIENGIVGALIEEKTDPNPSTETAIIFISGDTFIKPKKEYVYSMNGNFQGTWGLSIDVPVTLTSFTNDSGFPSVKLKWNSTYSGQFDLTFGAYKKTIVVESLF